MSKEGSYQLRLWLLFKKKKRSRQSRTDINEHNYTGAAEQGPADLVTVKPMLLHNVW